MPTKQSNCKRLSIEMLDTQKAIISNTSIDALAYEHSANINRSTNILFTLQNSFLVFYFQYGVNEKSKIHFCNTGRFFEVQKVHKPHGNTNCQY
jgi:hypothetical protein